MLIADNAVMSQDGIIEPRRGFGRSAGDGWQTGATAGSGRRWKSMRAHFYGDVEIHSLMDCETNYDNYDPGSEDWEMYIRGTSAYQAIRYKTLFPRYSSLSSPINAIPHPVDREIARIRFAESNNNVYFTGENGILKIDGFPPSGSDIDNSLLLAELAGVPQATDLVSASMKFDGSDPQAGLGCLDMDTQRAFRCVWARKDANGNEVIGAPSGRITVSNPKYEVSLSRGAASTTCVATINSGNWFTNFVVGDNVYVFSSDNAKFGSGSFVVSAVTSTTVTYTDTAIAAPAGAQTITYSSTTVNPKVGYDRRPINISVNVPWFVRNNKYILRIYMSGASASASSEPPDEMFLVYENSDSYTMRGEYRVTLSRSGAATVTVTFPFNHDPVFIVGDDVLITSNNVAFADGVFTLTGVTANTATYTDASSAATATATLQTIEGNDTSFGWVRDYKKFSTTISTTDALRGAPLYTNPSQEGILLSNSTPPLARDMAQYKGHMFYANTQQRSRFIFRLLSVDAASGGMDDGDSIIFDGVMRGGSSGAIALTANSALQTTDGGFVRVTSGSASQNIADTARNMVRAVNEYVSDEETGFIQAYYLSGANDPPGIICLESRELGFSTTGDRASLDSEDIASEIFAVYSDTGSYFEPKIKREPSSLTVSSVSKTGNIATVTFSAAHGLRSGDHVKVQCGGSVSNEITQGVRRVDVVSSTVITFTDFNYTVGTQSVSSTVSIYKMSQVSDNERGKNRMYYAKQNEPEHVPRDNFLEIGSEKHEIIRIFQAADSLWVLKEDGLYRVTGETAEDFDWSEFDLTVKIIAPESVASLSNQLFFLSNGGPVAVSETGVVKIGRPIEQDVLKMYSDAPTAVRNAATACSYESEGLYILCMPNSTVGDDTTLDNNLAWVYSAFSGGGCWSKWNVNWTWCGVNQATDILCAGDADGSFLLEERKSRTARDYADKGISKHGDGNTADTNLTVSAEVTSGGVITRLNLSNASADVQVGDVIYVSDTIRATVTSVVSESAALVATDSAPGSFTGNACTVFKAYQFIAQWQPVMGENPAESKLFSEVAIELRKPFFSYLKVGFISDKSKTLEKFRLTGYALRGNVADYPWDYDEFTNEQGVKTMRCPIPRNKRRATKLFIRVEHNVALERFSIQGIHVKYSGGGKADK